MKAHRTVITSALALAAFAFLATTPYPALSQPADSGTAATAERQAARHEHMKEHVQGRLARMAQRLEITAAQQDAWAAYTATVERMIPAERATPPADGDAAGLIRLRAERAAEHARKLDQLADATAALERVLSPEQQQALKKMMRHKRHGMHGRHRHAG